MSDDFNDPKPGDRVTITITGRVRQGQWTGLPAIPGTPYYVMPDDDHETEVRILESAGRADTLLPLILRGWYGTVDVTRPAEWLTGEVDRLAHALRFPPLSDEELADLRESFLGEIA